MDAKALEKFGLTEGESKVYLALLRIGVSTVGKIVKESQVSSSKIYDILDRLSKDGLVSSSIVNGRKNFEAKDPSRLREFIEVKAGELSEQKNALEVMIPNLQKIRSLAEPVQEAEILQGIRGIKTFWEMILTKLGEGDKVYLLGIPVEAESMLPYFNGWHKRRLKNKISCKMLYNQDAKHMAEERKKFPLTDVRMLPKQIIAPVYVSVAADYVATIVFGEHPLCIVIKNKQIAESYRGYFELIWKMSK